MQVGDGIGRWRLQGRLATRDHCEVWLCGDATTMRATMKVSTAPLESDSRHRFRQMDLHLGRRRCEGVMPILDHDAGGTGVAWYVMPLAVPVSEVLAGSACRAVEAVAAAASTLADLAEHGVAHRNIKAGNLLLLDGDWCLADFEGDTPADSFLDSRQRCVGSAGVPVPETLPPLGTTDAFPGDVHALATLLSSLLAGDSALPTAGISRLSTTVDYRWAPQLDRLIDWCTTPDPRRRPGMRRIAEELTAMDHAARTITAEGTGDLERRRTTSKQKHKSHCHDASRT